MKKILCIAPYQILPAKTGGQKSIDSFYQNLSKEFSVVCISTKNNDVSKAKGYVMKNILANSQMRYMNVFYFFTLSKVIKKERPDYIQLEHPYYGWLTILVSKYTGVKLIVRSHNIEGLRFQNLKKSWWKLLLKYEAFVHRRADINYFINDEDRMFAIDRFKLAPAKCFTITFGVDISDPPSKQSRIEQRNNLLSLYGFDQDDVIVLFNGAFDYQPNLNALVSLTQEIFPLIKDQRFKLLICGKNIPNDLIVNNTNPAIIFAGFVPDINVYLLGTSLFVNPISEGGGIKTKLVEALGFNLTSISYKNGAIGVSQRLCGDKLFVVEDNDIKGFVEAIYKATVITSDTPEAFYDHFSYERIIKKVKGIL